MLCPTHIRADTMKKLFTTIAITALLFGAFSINATAQPGKVAKDNTREVKVTEANKQETKVKNVSTQEVKVKNANTQETKVSNVMTQDSKVTKPVEEKKMSQEDWNKVIDDYEGTVGQCVSLYEKMKDAKDNKDLLTKFNESVEKVESLGQQIANAFDQLNRSQIHRYNMAKQKLAVIYQKG